MKEVEERMHKNVNKTKELKMRTTALEIMVDATIKATQGNSREIHMVKEDF